MNHEGIQESSEYDKENLVPSLYAELKQLWSPSASKPRREPPSPGLFDDVTNKPLFHSPEGPTKVVDRRSTFSRENSPSIRHVERRDRGPAGDRYVSAPFDMPRTTPRSKLRSLTSALVESTQSHERTLYQLQKSECRLRSVSNAAVFYRNRARRTNQIARVRLATIRQQWKADSVQKVRSMEDFRKQQREMTMNSQSINVELFKVKSTLSKTEEELQECRREVERKAEELRAVEKENALNESRTEELEECVRITQDHLDDARQGLEEARKALEEEFDLRQLLAEEHSECESRRNEAVSTYRKKAEELQEEVDTIRTLAEAKQMELEKVQVASQQRVHQAESEAMIANTKSAALEREVDAFKEKLDDLQAGYESRCDELTKQLAAKDDAVNAAVERTHKLEIKCEQGRDSIRELEEKLERAESSLMTESSARRQKEEALEHQAESLRLLTQESENAQRCAASSADEVARLRSELSAVNERICTQQSTAKVLHTRLSEVRSELVESKRAMQDVLCDFGSSLVNTTAQVQQALVSMSASAELVSKQELTSLSSRATQLEIELQKKHTENEALVAGLKDLEADYDLFRRKVAEEKKAADQALHLNQANQLSWSSVVSSQIGENLQSVQADLRNLRDAVRQELVSVQQTANESVSSAFTCATDLVSKYQRMYEKVHDERKRLHNELIDARGAIRVFCRVRPLKGEEVVGHLDQHPDTEDGNDCTLSVGGGSKNSERTFEYDGLIREGESQAEVFARMEPLIVSSLDGYNTCLLAYGQTGSGKTHTMIGDTRTDGCGTAGLTRDAGILPRGIAMLFELQHGRSSLYEYTNKLAVYEVYNNEVVDLMRSSPTKCDVLQGRDGKVVISELMWSDVQDYDDAVKLIRRSMKRRAEAATNMNAHSSRSHCVVSIEVTATELKTARSTCAKLSFVDLAGSECISKSGVTGQAQMECQHVNRSLSALGDVFKALSEKRKHVPYRNSRLTQALSDSIGGNAKLILIVTVSPDARNEGETLHTLDFGRRARQVCFGKLKRALSGAEDATAKKKRQRTQ